MSINRAQPEMGGIVNLHSAAPQCGSQGSNGGVKQGIGMRKMDLSAREGERVI